MKIFINNRDRFTSTKSMVEYLARVPNVEPVIIDNASTYPPLLDWYRRCPIQVIASGNLGPKAPWMLGVIPSNEGYIVTDSDLDLSNCPTDLVEHLLEGLQRFPKAVKAGLSLELNDLPESALGAKVKTWEAHYWKTALAPGWWSAGVDTTFAAYRPGTKNWPGILPAVRSDRPYTARHIPWYGITDEDEYYMAHANSDWASWAKTIKDQSCTPYSPPT